MTVEDAILEKLRALTPEKKREVLDFAEFLRNRDIPKTRRRNVRGMLSDLNVRLSEEDLRDVREEMWKHFPREGA